MYPNIDLIDRFYKFMNWIAFEKWSTITHFLFKKKKKKKVSLCQESYIEKNFKEIFGLNGLSSLFYLECLLCYGQPHIGKE